MMSMIDEEKMIKYLVLTLMKGIGPVTQNALLDMCGGIDWCFLMEAKELLALDTNGKLKKSRINSFVSQRSDKELWSRAEGIIKEAYKKGIGIIVREDRDYPYRFDHISDMPIVLYVKGSLKINDHSLSVGIVGARRCTAEGKEKAIEQARSAVNDGAALISGMAKGIDSYAHTAALKSHGYTVAVLGSGVDICYPREHEKLYEEIARSGCILSEYPPGTQPREYYFPLRNRLIAALSDWLYVIEAGRHSGTVSTVENGEKYGRKVERELICSS